MLHLKSISSFSILLIILGFGWSLEVAPKILIFTYSYNRPDFIVLQDRTFKRFLKDDYEFVVFNDARDPNMVLAIQTICEQLGIKCILIPQEIHDRPYLQRPPGDHDYHSPSTRNCNIVHYSLDTLGFDYHDIVALVDADLFLVKEFSIHDYLKDYNLAGYTRTRGAINYLWIGLVFLDMATMPNKRTINFNCGMVENTVVDSGGHSYYYLRDNPQAKVAYFNELCLSDFVCQNYELRNYDDCHTQSFQELENRGYSPSIISFIQAGPVDMELFLNGTFLHYSGACNWAGRSSGYHYDKSQILNNFIEAIFKDCNLQPREL